MKIRMVRASRHPPWPLWAVLVVLIWFGLGATALWLSFHFDRPIQLCLIKRLTGYPCPTCGFSRGLLTLMSGRVIQAWLYNPLLFSVLGVFLAVTAVRVIFARSIRITLTKWERIFAWILAIALFFANWAYVIAHIH